MPRFKLDENIPAAAKDLLISEGCDVETVLDEQLGGCLDSMIADAANSEDRILVTLDLDFADIRAYPPSESSGTWVLRPRTNSVMAILNVLKAAIEMVRNEMPTKRLWIVEPERIRIHE